MREFNDNFLAASNQATKEPLYTIEIAFDNAFTVLKYFTSSADAQHPVGPEIIDSVVKNISGTSQKIDPIKFVASIGSINFELLDKDSAITTLFNSELLVGDRGLREKRVRVYMGFAGLDWADYEVIQTQIITGVVSDGPVYKISCSDIQRIEKKDIFDLGKTNIQSTVELPPDTVLTAAITTTTGFSTINVESTKDVDGNFVFAASGAILIGAEIITYTGRTTTTFTGCVRGTNNTIATTHLVTSSVYQTMYTITVYDTSDFELNEHDAEYTDEPDQTVVYFKIDDEVFRASSKTSTTFVNCFRGALDTKPAVHEVDPTRSRDKRPEVEEYVYIETNAVKLIYGIWLGVWYNNPTSASLPVNWTFPIDTIWFRNLDFTGIGDDLWNNTVSNVNSGFKVRFEGLTKQDGKQFIERQILPKIGCFMGVYADGDIGLKRTTNMLSDAAYVVELNVSNINQNSSLAINHNQKAVANEFNIDWNWSALREDYTRSLKFIDASSIAIHQDATPINLSFRGLHGSIHTEATIKRIVQRLRDRYASPPIEMTLNVLPSLHGLEVGDVVRVNLANVRDYAATGKVLDRSFEIQQKSVNWITGNVTLRLFGSTSKAGIEVLSENTTVLYSNDTTLNGAITDVATTITLTSTTDFPASGAVEIESESITYAAISGSDLTGCTRGVHGTTNVSHIDTSAVHNSYYTDQGGTNLKSVSGYSFGDINSSTTLFGGATFSAGTYYHTGPLTIASGITVAWFDNLQLLIEGHLTWNGLGDAAGGGYAGALPGVTSGTKGYLAAPRSGGGIYADTTAGPFYERIPPTPMLGNLSYNYETKQAIESFELDYDGSTISGLPTSLIGTSGDSGGLARWVYSTLTKTANGGAGGTSGGAIMIISKGGSFGASGEITLSGGNGSLGSSITYARTDGTGTLFSGAGAGGAAGGCLWVVEGSGSTIPELSDNLTANTGTTPIEPTATAFNRSMWNPPLIALSQYVSNGNNTLTTNLSASRIQFLTDFVDEGEDDKEWVPTQVGNLFAASGTTHLLELGDGTIITRIKLTWDASTDQNIDRYKIWYFDSSGNPRESEDQPSREKTSTYIYPVVDGEDYLVFIAGINTFGNQGNAAFISHTVAGKSAAPSDPTSVALTAIEGGVEVEWVNPADKDLKYIEIFADTTSPTDPADLYAKLPSGRPSGIQKYVIPSQPGTVQYVKIKSVDSTANEGALVATTPANVTSLIYKDTAGSDLDNTQNAVISGIDAYSLDVSIGGVSAYSNDSIYYHTTLDSYENFSITQAGTTSTLQGNGRIYLNIGSDNADSFIVYKRLRYQITPLTWSNDRRFKTAVAMGGPFYYGRELYVGIGDSTDGIGFSLAWSTLSGNVTFTGYAVNGGTKTENTLSVSYVPSTAVEHILECTIESGTVKFYIDGVYETGKDITTNIPTLQPDKIVYLQYNNTATHGSSTASVAISEWKFYQSN